MSKPYVKIGFENGNLGVVATKPDGICAIVSSAIANGDFTLNKHFVVYSLKEAETLGIIPTVSGNYELHKTIKEFYAEAGTGTELWIYGVPKTRTYIQVVQDAEALLVASNRRVRFVIIKYAPTNDTTPVANGIHGNFVNVVDAAQTIAEDFTINKIHPVVFVLEAYQYTGVAQDLHSFEEDTYNRVIVMIGDTESRSGATATKGAAVGVLAGRIAKNQVHVNIGRVKDGSLSPLVFYIVSTPAEQVNVEPLVDKGFVTLTTHVGKSGYYFTDDPMACTVEDDYHFLTRRRVIDKAYLLANQVLTNIVLDNIPLTNEGKMQYSYAKGLEGEIERIIAQEMTAKGELSADVTKSNDTGVIASIDTTEIIATTSRVTGSVRVRPHGYARFIEFTIGFTITE